jgi:hypothetical protein
MPEPRDPGLGLSVASRTGFRGGTPRPAWGAVCVLLMARIDVLAAARWRFGGLRNRVDEFSTGGRKGGASVTASRLLLSKARGHISPTPGRAHAGETATRPHAHCSVSARPGFRAATRCAIQAAIQPSKIRSSSGSILVNPTPISWRLRTMALSATCRDCPRPPRRTLESNWS